MAGRRDAVRAHPHVAARPRRRRGHRARRLCFPRADRPRPQRAVFAQFVVRLRFAACSRRSNPWGPLVILVPVVGAIGVTFIVSKFAPEAKGHGVPEVMDAIYYGGGVIRPVVAVAKSLASALAIGSGAAVGREGPIIQIGSALGSTLGQLIAMSPGQRITLVAAGAGAGHRRDLQHADRRGAVRDRADAARGQRQHLPAGRGGDRDGNFHRPTVFRAAAGVSRADDRAAAGRARRRGAGLGALRRARRIVRGGGRRLYPRAAPRRGSVRAYPATLPAPLSRHAAGRRSDLRPLCEDSGTTLSRASATPRSRRS